MANSNTSNTEQGVSEELCVSEEFCQLIKLDSHIPSKAASREYTFTFAYKNSRPIPQTWEWMGNDNGTSFLDLPRELRDMIYVYVCDGMPHEGNGWRKIDEYAMDYTRENIRKPTARFQNCNIMRTCRQVHWEFAEVLYARPLQLTGSISPFHKVVAGSHILPLSTTYAHLVKRLAVIHSVDAKEFYNRTVPLDPSFEAEQTPVEQWRDIATAAMQLVKLFPALQTVRVLHDAYIKLKDRDPLWDSLLGNDRIARDECVETSERFLRAVRLRDFRKIKIPMQLELLHLLLGHPYELPLGTAVRNIRAAELRKNSKESHDTWRETR